MDVYINAYVPFLTHGKFVILCCVSLVRRSLNKMDFMSRWLKRAPLPKPENEESVEKKKRMEEVNKAVVSVPSVSNATRKGKKYKQYSPELRAAIIEGQPRK